MEITVFTEITEKFSKLILEIDFKLQYYFSLKIFCFAKLDVYMVITNLTFPQNPEKDDVMSIISNY